VAGFLGESVAVAAGRVAGDHGVEGGERRGIVAVRLLDHTVAGLFEHHAAADRIALEQQTRRTGGTAPRRSERSAGDRAGTSERDVAQDRRMHHLVDKAHLERAPRPDRLPGENHVEGRLESHTARKPLRAAHAGDEPELHLRRGERRLRMVRADAVAAGQRDLETAPEAGTVNRGDDGDAQRLVQRVWPVRLRRAPRRPRPELERTARCRRPR
jgi:hypothetical protein